jgi:hypothetical protein
MLGVPFPTVNTLGPVAVSEDVETITFDATGAPGEAEPAELAVYETRMAGLVTAKSETPVGGGGGKVIQYFCE